MELGPVLYSINTRLAYTLAEQFYGSIHYAWCAPRFDYANGQPASSHPLILCRRRLTDVISGDLHSDLIEKNRAGLLVGVEAKKEAGIIDDQTSLKIRSIIDQASIYAYLPMIYVIDYLKVRDLCEDVPISQKANETSTEIRISKLPRSAFEVIDILRIVCDTGIFPDTML